MPRTADLNLLRALEALLEERGVTRAADRLGLSQPATSAALAKLRRQFNDELLVRVGNGYQLTPLAARLRERTASALAMVDRVFLMQPDFDPATAHRDFVILVSDYTLQVLLGQLARKVSAQAPGVRLFLRQLSEDSVDRAPDSLRDVDGVLLPHGLLLDLPYQDLFDDNWVCLVATDNTAVGAELTMADLARLPWVSVFHRWTSYTTALRELRIHGVEPNVQLVSESYWTLPTFIAGTNRIALTQSRLARRLTEADGVRALPCPVPIGPLKMAFWWHPNNTADAGHCWLRDMLRDVAAKL